MPGEVLSTYLRDSRTTAIGRVNELVVEVVIEPAVDLAGDAIGYYYWLRTSADPQPSEQAAIAAAMTDVARISRIQPVAVVQLAMGELLGAC